MKIHTKPTVELIDSMGDDLRVANSARVSFAKWNDELTAKDERLIKYLAKHSHWTPFSQVSVTVRISAPIFVARQWFKHQVGVTRNETSRRYVDDAPEFYIPEVFHNRPSGGIKQGRGEVLSEGHNRCMHLIAQDQARKATDLYNGLIQDNIAPEEARMFLPQNMMTTWVETGSLAYFARACKLRSDTSHAQLAIQPLSNDIWDVMFNIAPISWCALMESGND